jgi:phenylacetate-CoA ligase
LEVLENKYRFHPKYKASMIKGESAELSKRKKLSNLIREVTHFVPYYKQFLERTDTYDDPVQALAQLPITEKALLHSHAEQFYSERIDKSRREDLLIAEVTTGSSGLPIMCYKTKEERFQLALSAWKQRRAIDARVNQSNLFCLLHSHSSQKKVVDNMRNLHSQNISKVLHYLRDEFQPLIIHCSPSDIFEYAKFIEREQFSLEDWQLGFIETNSEVLTLEQKQEISQRFRTRVINNYGCREAWNIAYECREGNLHLSDEVHVEIIDMKTGDVIQPGSSDYGEVVITALPVKHFPFIRYRLGDIGRLSRLECACGLENEVLELYEARKINLIHRLTNDNTLTNGVSLFKGVFSDLVASGYSDIVQNIIRYKIIQTSTDVFDIYLVLHEALTERLTEIFTHYATLRIGEGAVFNFLQKAADDPVFEGKNYSFLSRVQG